MVAPIELYFKAVEQALLQYVQTVKMNGTLNLQDDHIFAESFYGRFLNMLFGFNLKSANLRQANFAAIDLIDDDQQVCCQVTSEVSKTKIQSTLDKLAASGLTKYRLIMMFIDDDVRRARKWQLQIPDTINFDPNTDIFDSRELLRHCQQADSLKLLNLKNLCEQEIIPSSMPLLSNSVLVSVLNAVAKIDVATTAQIQIPNSFQIEDKIVFNGLEPIQTDTIEALAVYNPAMDSLYQTFAENGTAPIIIFQKLVSLYQNQTIRHAEKSAPLVFLDLVADLMQYVKSTQNLNRDLSDEQIELCCRVILVDAFVRCKIFKDPEGYYYDSTN